MSAQDPGLDILEALLKGRQPPSPPPPPGQPTEDVVMEESQERFVGALRPEARTYTGRPELCWSFWLKGHALVENGIPLQDETSGTVNDIPEETIKTHMRDAFRRYLVYAIRTAGYFPAMVQRVDEWSNNPESQVRDLEGMTNSEMLKITLKRDTATLDPREPLTAPATKVSIRWGGTRELYHWDTPTNDANTVWLFLPMIEMFNRMINDSTNSSPNNRDPIQAMQSVNEAMFGFEVGSLRVTSYNFPVVVGERPFEPDTVTSTMDIASVGSNPFIPGPDYDAWYSAMEPTAIDPNVYGRIITINELEDYYGWKESSAERYIQWSMICKNMSTHTLRITNLESAPVGALVAPTGVYVGLRTNLKSYLRLLQTKTFRLTQPQLAVETASQLATTIVDYWGSSENLEIRVEKALLQVHDLGRVVSEEPVMRICVRWRLPKNVAIDMMHDLRHHVDGRPRNPQWMETHVCANVAKLTSCRIPEAEFPNYSNEHRRRWKPRMTDVPFRRSEFDAWDESYFLD